ncbi:hypothetical protein [Mycobacteroides abscessus]|uniref:Uncharacterized protein n=1 Tax=Mycobacteroides abscessus 1948 TaxID=1299323 RepID=A0A829QR45_9MYCO|nr:hypothetical protein [Mycobacteroides abscessus]EUA64971.1 hypothetical protein I542_5149 [Mycobacteroides abscessus 1948]EIU50819.1 hypothetical protein MA6G0125R_0095 [Mycobacteroides abscessus 6G-0125-R]EIU66122.1 hypothetical protein MA6G1108_1050 [Mycobacteroides abscessus 6G-1108]EIU97733.1 hypothetical protein MA6G0212_1123 [Mycobacteroides abscessus 6G-0212]EIV00662.1 hypothetical protein MA6G0728R_1056 [Mycobacteroides abscessus 6G-0728-R]
MDSAVTLADHLGPGTDALAALRALPGIVERLVFVLGRGVGLAE